MLKYYVYFLLDPRNHYLPFYIGKGCNFRYLDHLQETEYTTYNLRKYRKIQSIRRSGFEPKVLLFHQNMSEKDAYFLEREQILRFGRIGYEPGGILTNICLDANPPSWIGKTHSPETKILIGLGHKGKPISEEQKVKLSEALKGRKNTWGDKISESLRGKPKSEDHRRQIGNAHRGKEISENQKEKLRLAISGKKRSPETRERMRLAALVREARKREILNEI